MWKGRKWKNRSRRLRRTDMQETPPRLAKNIVRFFVRMYGISPGLYLDPCKGRHAAFYRYLPTSPESPKRACEITSQQDFFEFHEHVAWIITNPIWGVGFPAFLIHAMEVADNVVFLLPVYTALGQTYRYRITRQMGFGVRTVVYYSAPRSFTMGGFALCAVHWQRGYTGPVSFHDRTGHPFRKKASGAQETFQAAPVGAGPSRAV